MIIGIGIDIESTEKTATSLRECGDEWLSIVFTDCEINMFNERGRPLSYLTSRIAVKEAAMKALGTGLSKDVDWKDFEVVSKISGAPALNVMGWPARRLEQMGVTKIWLSISHLDDYSVAQVILETDCPRV